MKIANLTLFDLSIPLRVTFRHSLAERSRSRNLLVRAELENGCVGYGEGVPVEYVTGETFETGVSVIREHYFPAIRARSFASYRELGRSLCELRPIVAEGICHTSAKCALELALLDAFGRAYNQPMGNLAALVPLPGIAVPRLRPPRYGMALTAEARWIRRRFRWLRLYGFRDYKLKVGLDPKADEQIVAWIMARLRRPLARTQATLRVDANAAYSDVDCAVAALAPLIALGVESVEQPMPPGQDDHVAELARRLGVPILLDESIRTLEEAEDRLQAEPPVGVSIRLSKNGGFFDGLRLASLCRERGVPFQLGCHVGETGLLTAAQIHLAAHLPDARYLEGAFGTHLLVEDVVRENIRFGFRGRAPRLRPVGLGVDVEERRLKKFLLSSLAIE